MGQLLHESVNPHGTLRAIVEDDGKTLYFYLWNGGQSEQDTRMVWVQNLGAPSSESTAREMAEGRAPENLAEYCREPSGIAAPEASALKVTWLPEGNGAALWVGDEIQAIIPPAPTGHRVQAFSIHAAEDGPLALALTPDNPWRQRFIEAEDYWKLWMNGDFWEASRESLGARYEECWGAPEGYFSIDNGQWPPRALVRSRSKDWTVYATLGLSLLPQPNAPTPAGGPKAQRRMELAAVLPAAWPEERATALAQQLAQMAWFPWVKNTWLGHGHTFEFDVWNAEDWRYCILLTDPAPVEVPVLGPVLNEPVNLLFLLPATRAELDRAKAETTFGVIEDTAEKRWDAFAHSTPR